MLSGFPRSRSRFRRSIASTPLGVFPPSSHTVSPGSTTISVVGGVGSRAGLATDVVLSPSSTITAAAAVTSAARPSRTKRVRVGPRGIAAAAAIPPKDMPCATTHTSTATATTTATTTAAATTGLRFAAAMARSNRPRVTRSSPGSAGIPAARRRSTSLR